MVLRLQPAGARTQTFSDMSSWHNEGRPSPLCPIHGSGLPGMHGASPATPTLSVSLPRGQLEQLWVQPAPSVGCDVT